MGRDQRPPRGAVEPSPAGWMAVFRRRHRCFVGEAELHFVAEVRHEHAQVEVDALDRGSRVDACRRTDVLLTVVWGKFLVSKKQALRRCSSKSATCEDSPASGNSTSTLDAPTLSGSTVIDPSTWPAACIRVDAEDCHQVIKRNR